MKNLNIINDDLLNSPDRIIVHGCNAQGVMGAGVAKAIRTKYPEAYSNYFYMNKNNSNMLQDI